MVVVVVDKLERRRRRRLDIEALVGKLAADTQASVGKRPMDRQVLANKLEAGKKVSADRLPQTADTMQLVGSWQSVGRRASEQQEALKRQEFRRFVG